MFDATCTVLTKIMEDGCIYSSRGDADAAYNAMTSFEFIFILHLTRDIMGITDDLCQALQSQSQHILNALQLMKTTKFLIQKLRDSGWSTLLENVICFCNRHDIDVPDMSNSYVVGRGRKKQDHITIEHHYRVDIFYTTVDSQLQKLNIRFNEHTLELFLLSSTLDPRDGYKSFKVDDICTLVEKFYQQDFSSQEKIHLRYQLQHYILDVNQCAELQDMATIVELCEGLVKTGTSKIYPLVDRLLRLVLTLPVSTTTTERAFSVMKLVKTRLRNKMRNEFLADSMTVYIEKEIARKFSTNSLIVDFDVKSRKGKFF